MSIFIQSNFFVMQKENSLGFGSGKRKTDIKSCQDKDFKMPLFITAEVITVSV